MVLTLFQTMLESVPRPIIRSMSTSWVVEVAEDPSIQHEQSPSSGGICKVRTKGMVRGMWQFTMIPGGRFMVV